MLGSAGVVAAITSQHPSLAQAGALVLAVLTALVALFALVPQRFPTWEATLRDYVVAGPVFTTVTILDTTIDMVLELKRTMERKVRRLRLAAWLLGLSVVATAIGTIAD